MWFNVHAIVCDNHCQSNVSTINYWRDATKIHAIYLWIIDAKGHTSFMIQYILLKKLEITCLAVKGLYFHLLVFMDPEILLIFNLAKYLGRYSLIVLRKMRH